MSRRAGSTRARNTTTPPAPEWDAFISHAFEDKDDFVRPLAIGLAAYGVKIWYDEFSLKPGDSLSAAIAKGLRDSRYGVVVLSKAFIEKPWPQQELQGLMAAEMGGISKIIPVWHGLTSEDVLKFSPMLADKLAVTTAGKRAEQVVLQLISVIRPDIFANTPYEILRQIAAGDALNQLRLVLNFGRSSNRELEQDVLENVAGIGMQLGIIGDALVVLFRHLELPSMSPTEEVAVRNLQKMLSDIADWKARHGSRLILHAGYPSKN